MRAIFDIGNPAVSYEVMLGDESLSSGTLAYRDGVLQTLSETSNGYTVLQTEEELDKLLVSSLSFVRGGVRRICPFSSSITAA